MEELIKATTLQVAQILEVMAAVIICLASLKAFLQFVRDSVSPAAGYVPRLLIRLDLGKSLALALEVLLGADILQTAIAPTWNDIGMLAAIATLRTALNFFLERELRTVEDRD